MKRVILSFLLLLIAISFFGHSGNKFEDSDFFKGIEPGDKAAILIVHFGTTHADTRSKTIDVINAKVKNAFPSLELRDAYTSRIVVKRLKDRGIIKQNPLEVLGQLRAEGYSHILVQPSTIINGVEMESLYKNVDEMKDRFKDIRIGDPLLSSPEDYEKVVEILTQDYDENIAYVWVGHGTYDASTAQYAMLDYMLKAKGHSNCFVGTIEGYPGYEDMLNQLRSSGLKRVVLIPFMFVAGEHVKNDIAGDWKDQLETDGYAVDVCEQGLGENSRIQDIYISHLKFKMHHRKIGIMEKKKIYQTTGEKLHSDH